MRYKKSLHGFHGLRDDTQEGQRWKAPQRGSAPCWNKRISSHLVAEKLAALPGCTGMKLPGKQEAHPWSAGEAQAVSSYGCGYVEGAEAWVGRRV